MKLLEYEAKQLLAVSGIPVPKSYIAEASPQFLPVVLKSQVSVGGRGKAGGVRKVSSPAEYTAALQELLQLSIKGFTPKKLLAEEVVTINRELYLSVIVDKTAAEIQLMAHTNGGVEVEENKADEFFRTTLSASNISSVGERLADYFDLASKSFALQDMVQQLYECFVKNDALLIEINPLIITNDGGLVAGDCKMACDDAAAYRHAEWNFEAGESNASFVTLDQNGEVATIANGAGLAMATVDAVKQAGLSPANFLDVGGGANEASVLAAFQKIMEYPNIKVIVINIFAGITRCDEVAKAIIAAKAHITNLPPLSIRLAGTNFEQAAELLQAQSILTLATLEDCIQHAKEHAA